MNPGDIVAYRTSNHIRFGTISEIVARQTKNSTINEWHVERVHTDGGGTAILTDEQDIIVANAQSWDLHAWWRQHPMIAQMQKAAEAEKRATEAADRLFDTIEPAMGGPQAAAPAMGGHDQAPPDLEDHDRGVPAPTERRSGVPFDTSPL